MCMRMLIFGRSYKKLLSYFSKLEITLWVSSIALILISFIAFDRANYLTLIASLFGVTSLIFNAKGNPTGQVLMVIFSLLYGIIDDSILLHRIKGYRLIQYLRPAKTVIVSFGLAYVFFEVMFPALS